MRKNLFLIISAVILIAFIMTGCSQASGGSGGNGGGNSGNPTLYKKIQITKKENNSSVISTYLGHTYIYEMYSDKTGKFYDDKTLLCTFTYKINTNVNGLEFIGISSTYTASDYPLINTLYLVIEASSTVKYLSETINNAQTEIKISYTDL
jgi:hypothetical protein